MHQAWLRTRRYFWTAAAFFAFGVLLGVLLPFLARPVSSRAAHILLARLAPLAHRFREAGPGGRVLLILANNLRAAAIILLSAPVVVWAALSMSANGLALGLLGVEYNLAGRLTAGQFVMGILPHGVFEIPAVLLAVAQSWRLGLEAWRWLLRGTPRVPWRLNVVDFARLSLAILALLIVAAVMEVFVSPIFLPTRLA